MNLHEALKLCHIEPWVEIGEDCVIHPFSYFGKFPSVSPSIARQGPWIRSLSIGAGTEIGPHATLYSGATIGSRCLIGDGANIREGAKIGNRCIIGTNVTINYGAELEDDVRVQTGSFVTDGCKVGRGTFIGINVTMCSDSRRQLADYVYEGSNPPIIGRGCLIGSGSIILPGVTIGNGAVIGAGSLITKDVPPGSTTLPAPSRVIAWQK